MVEGSGSLAGVATDERVPYVEMLVGFGDALRKGGIPVGSGDLLTYCGAMALLNPADLVDLYWSGRITLVTQRNQIPLYDRVFLSFFGDHADELPDQVKEALESLESPATIDVPDSEPREAGRNEQETDLGFMASDIEIWRNKSFATCTAEELAALRRIMTRIRLIPPQRRTRRSRPAPTAGRPDMRRTVRNALRTQGDPRQLFWRQRRPKVRPLILILDVSGSMAEYSRNLIQFAYSARRAASRVEVFCFGTRLTRITRALQKRQPDDALDEAARSVFDWEGGTRIGHAIDTFVRQYARRGMSRGAVVVICSDGLDRGDPALLAGAMERLKRLCHKVVWMNPHRGDDANYTPNTLGMMVAEPHVDLLLSGHNLASLEELAIRLPELR